MLTHVPTLRRSVLLIVPLVALLGGVWLSSSSTPSAAQGSCPALVEQAIAALDVNCADTGRNSACYGYNLVSASFLEDVPDDFFVQPADQTRVDILETLGTSVMDTTSGQWGVALMSLQANIPNSVPGQSVKFVLIGDVELENAVAPEDSFSPVDPVEVTTDDRLNLRSAPGLNANVIAVTDAGETLLADGLDESGDWVRIVRAGAVGWVFRELLSSEAELDALPTLNADARMPMQSFYLRNGIGQPQCEESPADALLVQGPQGITVEFTINGAEFKLSSTMLVRVLPGSEFMEIITLAGDAEVDGRIIPAGTRSVVCLSPEDNRGLDGQSNDQVVSCGASEPEPVEDVAGWCTLGEIPASVLNYPVPIDCEQGIILPPEPETPGSDVQLVNCATLRQTSPLGTAPEGNSPFYWDGVEGVDRYVATVRGLDGSIIGQAETQHPTTTATLGYLPFLGTATWDVTAYIGDVAVCQTGPTTVSVVGNPEIVNQPIAPPITGLYAEWRCGATPFEVFVDFINATPGDDVKILYNDPYFSVVPPPPEYIVVSDDVGSGSTLVSMCDVPAQGTVIDLATSETFTMPSFPGCPGFSPGC